MLSYETLAVIVLALSATPAFSVPVLYALRISSPGLYFLTSVITLVGITNNRLALPLRKNRPRVAVASCQVY